MRPAGLFPFLASFAAGALLWFAGGGCQSRTADDVILYCAQDQVYAEPILADFTRQTGIRVRAVFDSEAVKTVGLANRLLAERTHPVADVFWGNEELRTRQLAAQGVFAEPGGWAAFGHRSRRWVVRSNAVPNPAPTSWRELTNQAWRGKISLALPLFGTTATHFLALRAHWGESNWLAWCRALAANQPFIEEGNSHVVQRVARGEASLGLTDSDDIRAAQREGRPVQALPPSDESLWIPNTVGIVAGAPHPEAARRLFDHLQSPAVAQALVAAGALEPESNETKTSGLHPSWAAILQDMDSANSQLRDVFRR